MKKTNLLKDYKLNIKTYNIIKKRLDFICDYFAKFETLETISKNDISIDSETLTAINYAIEDTLKNQKMIEKWQALSNSKKRNYISTAILFAIKKDFYFNRGASTYNKETKTITQKAYTKAVRVSVYSLIYQVAILLSEEIIYNA